MPGESLQREPSLALLLECAGTDPDPARLSTLVSAVDDWPEVLRLATDHGLVPRLVTQLADLDDVPRGVAAKLRDRARTNALEGLEQTDVLFSLLDALETEQIDAIPFKGPVLGALAYDGPTRRSFIDLDVLVRQRDARRALEVLADRGYRHIHDVADRQLAGFVRARHVFELYDATAGNKVELHWRLVPRNVPFPLDYDEVWARSTVRSVLGHRCRVLSPEDRLLYLCVHGSWHRWDRIKWLADVAATCAAQPIDRSVLGMRAKATGTERMLELGCLLAADLLGADPPVDVQRTAHLEKLVESVTRGFTDDDAGPFAEVQFRYRVRERARDRLRYLLAMATQPMPADFAKLRLPSGFVGLYALIRPLWLMRDYGRDLFAMTGPPGSR